MFTYSHRISGLRHWKTLANKVVKEKSITICDMTNFSCESGNFTYPLEISSKFVKIENCNREFIFYNINPFIFPNIKLLYIKSHPYGHLYLNLWNKYTSPEFRGYIDHKYKHFLGKDTDKWSVITKEM